MLAVMQNEHMLLIMNRILNGPEQTEPRQLHDVALAVKELLQRYDTVAYVLGVKQSRTVKSWAQGSTVPSDPQPEMRLLTTEKLATTVRDNQRPWVSASWMIANNPLLLEDSPAELIQSLTGTEADVEILSRLNDAAEYFAAHTPAST